MDSFFQLFYILILFIYIIKKIFISFLIKMYLNETNVLILILQNMQNEEKN